MTRVAKARTRPTRRACGDTGNDVGALTDGPKGIVPANYNHRRMFDNVRRVTRQVAAYGSAAVALEVPHAVNAMKALSRNHRRIGCLR